MSFYDLFRVDEEEVDRRLQETRMGWPHCRIEARVENEVVVLSGEVDTAQERQSIVDGFRAIRPDITPVVAGALRQRPPPPAREASLRARPSPSSQRTSNSASTRATKRIYRVQLGDSLETIAQKFYGDAAAWRLLAAANSDVLERPGQLQPGLILEIPESHSYTVRPEDTLEALAGRLYGDSSHATFILEANADLPGRQGPLMPGQRIQLPLLLGRSSG